MCQCTLFDVGGVEKHSIEYIEYCTKIKAMSKMSKIDKVHITPMYVEDVEDGKRTYTHILAHNFLNT